MKPNTAISAPSMILGFIVAAAVALAFAHTARQQAYDQGYQKRRRQEAALRVTAIRWVTRTPEATPQQVISLLTENACELDDDSATSSVRQQVAYTDVLGVPVVAAQA